MSLRIPILSFLTLVLISGAYAQDTKVDRRHKLPSWLPQPPERRPKRQTVRKIYKPVGFPNVLTLNFPALMMIQKNGPGGGGIEYERFLNKSASFSASVAAYAFKTFSYQKEDGPSLTLSGYNVMPAVLYHPWGNRHRVDFSAGIGVALGNLQRRVDSLHLPGPVRSSREQGQLSAVLGQANLAVHQHNAFVFGLHLSIGTLLQPSNQERLIIQGGLKFGLRF